MNKRRSIASLIATAFVALVIALAGCAQNQPAPEPAPEPEPAPAVETKVEVPNVIWLEEGDAEKHLVNLGFSVGGAVREPSDDVPKGVVISQNPGAFEPTERGATIKLTVSSGPEEPQMVVMPDLIGKGQVEAERQLISLHIIAVRQNPIVTNDVAPGKICMQSVAAGTEIPEGTTIAFATAIADLSVAVPDVTGKTLGEATAALTEAGLGHDETSAYSNTVEKDKIISQSVEAGAKVKQGTVITLQLSLGPAPKEKVKVPDIMTYTLDDAINALTSAGLKYRWSGDEDGTVYAFDPPAGTEVEVDSVVSFVLQHPATLIAVPDVAGMDGESAAAAITAAGLNLDYDRRNPERILSGTDPVAGTLVDPDTIVSAVYGPEPEPEPEPTPEPGAWTVSTDFVPSITQEDADRFNQALADQVGADYTPCALIATQTVSGTNYAYLATSTAVAPGASGSWVVVTVYEDADGNVSLASVTDIAVDDVRIGAQSAGLAGAWVANAGAASALSGDAASVFDTAMSGYTGVSAQPIALLGTQPVAGTNYRVLCVGAPVTANPSPELYVATIYQDASGNVEISSMDSFNIAAYVQ